MLRFNAKIITTFVFTALFCSYYEISLGQAPKYSNEFLTLGIGARALGMSNSVLASTKDVTAGYWNPAGLVFVQSDLQLGLMHSEYFAGIAKYDYAGIAARLDDRSALSFSFIRFGIDDIPNTIDLIDSDGNIDFNRITAFSAADNALMFSYARKSNNEKLVFGGSTKVIYRRIGDFATAWGFGIDAGMHFTHEKWQFALTGKDITSTFNAWSYDLPENMKDVFAITGNIIPVNSTEITLPRLQGGLCRTFIIKNNFHISPEINFDMTFDKMRNVLIRGNTVSIDPRAGMEAGYKNIVFLRAGIGNFQKETGADGKKRNTFQPNMGIGVIIKKNFYIDYALTDIGDNSIALYSNVFSVKFNINRKKEENL